MSISIHIEFVDIFLEILMGKSHKDVCELRKLRKKQEFALKTPKLLSNVA